MTAARPVSLSTEGARSLEVRWILPGPVAAEVPGLFGRFPAEALEVKVYCGNPGLLEVAGRARGRHT